MIHILPFPQCLQSPPSYWKKILSFLVCHNVQITACHTINTHLHPNFLLRRGTKRLSNKESVRHYGRKAKLLKTLFQTSRTIGHKYMIFRYQRIHIMRARGRGPLLNNCPLH
jgi:hypothetical protein